MPEQDNIEFRKKTYKNLKTAFGDDYTLTEDQFNKNMDSDTNFVSKTYKNLKTAFGDDYSLSEDDFKKKVPPISTSTTSASSNGSNPTQPTSGSGVSQSRDTRGVNPKLGFLSDIVSELNPNAPKLQPGQSVDEWGKALTEYAKQYPVQKEGEPWKKEDAIKRLQYKVRQRKADFESFMDEKIAETTELPEYEQNLALYRQYLAQNEPEKLRQFDEKRNYQSGLPYGIGNLTEGERQQLDVEFYDKALENKQRYLNIKWDKLKSTIDTPEFQQMLSIQQATGQEIAAMNESYAAGNLSEDNYRSNFEELKRRYEGVSMQVDPIVQQAEGLLRTTEKNLADAEQWIKRYPIEAQRRLREIADDAHDEAMYNVMPSQKAAANFTNQVGRGVTEFLANVVSLPQVFSQDDSYGVTDRLADVSQQWASSINDDLFPIPEKMNKGLVNKDYSVNWDLVLPKTVRTLTDMGIMASTGTPAGMVASSFAMNAKGYYDEGLAQGMKPSEASQFSVIMGSQQALLELVNPETALLRGSLTKMGTSQAVDMLTKGVPMKDVIKEVSKATGKNMVMENTQEMLQMIGDMSGKMAANAITGSEFDFSNVGQDIKETLLLTTLVSGIAGGGISASQTSRSELEKRALLSAVEDPELLLAATNNAVAAGQLGEAAATKINITVGNLKQNLDALPSTVSETERSEVVNALFDKSKLMEVAANENLDPGIKKVYEKKIGELDAAVSKIISKYIPKEGVETVEVETPRGVVEEEVITEKMPEGDVTSEQVIETPTEEIVATEATTTPVSETVEPAQSTQKADIEKTLYGTISGSIPLSQALPNGVYVDLGDGLFAYVDKNDKIAAIVDKNNGYIVSKSFWNANTNTWQLPNQSNLKDDAKRFGVDEKTYIKKYQDAVNNLNAQSEAVKEDTTTTPPTDEKGNEKGRQKGLLTSESEDAAPIPEAPPITEGATETEIEIDEPTTQVFIAKDGSTVEETKLATLVVKDKKGKRVEPKQRAKILRQYRKEKLQGGKRIEEVDLNREDIQGEEAMRYVAENSTSPAQLLELMGKQSSNQNEMTSNDFYIAENIDTVTPESWNRFGDRNTVTKDIKKNYIRKSGTTIDEIAQAASYAMNKEGDGTEISPEEVFEFMKDNPNGIKDAYIPTNPDAEMLKDAFIALTGMTPTKSMIARALKEESIRFDENFAGLEPVEQEVGTLREGEVKDRRTYKRYEKLTDVSGTTKAQLPNDAKEYLVQTNKMSIAEARATIRDIGIAETDKLIRDLNNGINGAVRSVAAAVLLKTYEEKGMVDEHTNLTRWIILHLTDAGQTIQASSLLEALKPDYTLAGSEFEYEKATGEKLPEHLRKRFEVIGKEIEALEKKAQGIKDKLKEKALEDATVNIIDSVKRESKAPAKKKMQSLSAEKKSRKAELKKKYFGIFNDFTNIPRLLVDKEFLEYNKLILEEAAGDFKNFVKILIAELGSKTRPYAREFYKAAGGTELPELEKAYYDEEGKIKIPKEVIREIVMTNDIKKADELVAKVMEYVQQDFPEATDTEVKESITEYGKTVNPSKDQIDAEIRRLKRDGKLELGLKDAQEGKGVKRSGLQREKPTDYQRDLMRKINEELKRYPEDLASVEKKWASALDRVKTHLNNTIADTKKRIQDIKDGIAEPLPSKKRGFELDEEAKVLQEERDNLKKILSELEPKQEMSDEARVKVALAAAERAIAATADKINAQEFEYKKKKEPLNTPELVAARERLKLGKDVLNRMREESGFAEQHRYDLWKKRIQKRITDLQEKIDNKDFSVAPKKVMEINQEVLELRVKADKLKFERDVEIEKARIKSLAGLAKLTNQLVDLSGVPKSLMASADLSAPLRQGAILGVRHPTLAYAAGKEMMKQLKSEEAQEKWLAELHESEVYPFMKHSKLFLSEPSIDLKAKEEQFLSNLADRIPIWGKYVVKPSGRAYNGYLNKLRTDVFTQFYYALKQDGITGAEFEKELKAYATFINVATGRGSLGPLEGSALVLNLAFFSPRFITSRIMMLNPYFYYKLGPRVGWYAFRSFSTYIGVASMTLYLIAAMFGGDDEEDKFTVELDPRSSDFGKLKWGDIRYDIWAGEQGYVRLAAQFLSNSRKSTTTGEVVKLGEGYKPTTRFGLIGDFLMNKRAPVPTAVMNTLNGVTNFGEPTTWSEEVLKLGIPIYTADIYELYQADQANKILGATIPSLLGVGVNFQNSNKKLPSTPEEIFEEMHNRAVKKAESEALRDYKKTVPGIQRQEKLKKLQEKAIKERAKEFDIEYIKK